MVIALTGFLSQFDKTPKIVLERHSDFFDRSDKAILLAILTIVCSLFVSYPIAYNPARHHLAKLIFKSPHGQFTQRQNIILTSIFLAITSLFATFVPSIDKVICILGGLLSSTVDFVIPAYCLVKLNTRPWKSWRVVSMVGFFGVLALIGYISVGITIY